MCGAVDGPHGMDGPLGIATELCVELEADKSMLEGGKGGGGGGLKQTRANCALKLQPQADLPSVPCSFKRSIKVGYSHAATRARK